MRLTAHSSRLKPAPRRNEFEGRDSGRPATPGQGPPLRSSPGGRGRRRPARGPFQDWALNQAPAASWHSVGGWLPSTVRDRSVTQHSARAMRRWAHGKGGPTAPVASAVFAPAPRGGADCTSRKMPKTNPRAGLRDRDLGACPSGRAWTPAARRERITRQHREAGCLRQRPAKRGDPIRPRGLRSMQAANGREAIPSTD